MAAQQLLLPFRPVINLKGGLEAGAILEVYFSGTSTFAPIYSDSALTSSLQNPLEANGFGIFPAIYYRDGASIRVVVKDSGGSVLADQDPYVPNTDVYVTPYSDVFEGNGVATTFTLEKAPGSVDVCQVFIDGVRQTPTTDYTLSGRVLTLSPAPYNGATILVTYSQALISVLPEKQVQEILDLLGPNTNIHWLPASTGNGTAERGFIDTAPANHVGSAWAALNVQSTAPGSEGNGPTNADYGQIISVAKQGYAGGFAASGEIDALSIFVRQDGPDGLASGNINSSDAAGILINAQNIGTCGFLAQYEGISTNVNRVTFAIDSGIRTQIGVLDMNGGTANKFGFGAIADAGVITSAFLAQTSGTGSFTNILNAPGSMLITANGDYLAGLNEFWPSGAWTITRSAPENGNTQILHRGTGSLFLNAFEGNILFGTSGAIRTVIDTDGTLRPQANEGAFLGSVNQRWLQMSARQIELGTVAGTTGVLVLSGPGSPEGVLAANPGSLFLRTDGGAGTALYIKESGTGNTGWVGK